MSEHTVVMSQRTVCLGRHACASVVVMRCGLATHSLRAASGSLAHTASSSSVSLAPGGPASIRSASGATPCCSSRRSKAAHARGNSRLLPSGGGGESPPCSTALIGKRAEVSVQQNKVSHHHINKKGVKGRLTPTLCGCCRPVTS